MCGARRCLVAGSRRCRPRQGPACGDEQVHLTDRPHTSFGVSAELSPDVVTSTARFVPRRRSRGRARRPTSREVCEVNRKRWCGCGGRGLGCRSGGASASGSVTRWCRRSGCGRSGPATRRRRLTAARSARRPSEAVVRVGSEWKVSHRCDLAVDDGEPIERLASADPSPPLRPARLRRARGSRGRSSSRRRRASRPGEGARLAWTGSTRSKRFRQVRSGTGQAR